MMFMEFQDLLRLSDDQIGRLLKDVADVALSKLLVRRVDWPVVRYTDKQARAGRRLGRWLREEATPGKLVRLPNTNFRTIFLYGAAELVEGTANEYAIAGFGFKDGNRSRITEVLVIKGERGRVDLPPELARLVFESLSDGRFTEVLIIHNHPDGAWRDIKNAILGPQHLPSGVDRSLAFNWTQLANMVRAQVQRPAEIRFFLVENGDVKEFGGFSIADLLAMLLNIKKSVQLRT